jgi:hypothetical protein
MDEDIRSQDLSDLQSAKITSTEMLRLDNRLCDWLRDR